MSGLIDTHVHFWDLERGEYSWLGPELGVLNRSFHLDEVEPELRSAAVDGAVLVQADNNEQDTRLMLEEADRYPWVVGVVGWLDLEGEGVAEDADRLAAIPLIVGIRHLIHMEADPDWLIRPAVIEGLRAVSRVGLAYDVVSVLPRHLEHVPTVARAVPGLRIMIDHLSKPPIAQGDLGDWSRLLAAAAEYENVHAKISGLDTAAGPNWTLADLQPAVTRALELFSPDRLVYGGDWPVNLLGGGYARQYAAFEELLSDLSPVEQAAIRNKTATRVYRLDGYAPGALELAQGN